MLMQRNAPPPLVTEFDATPAQLALPWSRNPGYRGLSPHGLGVARNPVRFFFNYCAPYAMKIDSFEQTLPMAVGSAVDGMLKQKLAADEWALNRRAFYRAKVNRRSFGIFGTVDKHNRRPIVRDRATQCFEALLASPVYDHLRMFKLIDMESDSPKATWVHGAPLNGKLDFLFGHDNEPRNIISDLKVNGAFTEGGSTPNPGYSIRFDYDLETKSGVECPAHDKAGFPLEELNWGFATQLATYALMEASREQKTPFPDVNAPTRVILVQLTFKSPSKEPKVRKDGTQREWVGKEGMIVVTAIDSYISASFQRSVLDQYRTLWSAIQSKTLVPSKIAAWGVDTMTALAARENLDSLVI